MDEYRGDVDDPRYEGWSYLGDRYRCPIADERLSCHHRANELLAGGDEAGLRRMVDDGHRCAFVRLMDLLVNADRVADLRELALAGDERAGVTLAEYLVRRGDEEGLRRETRVLPRTALWLAGMLRQSGRDGEALTVLTGLAADERADDPHREEARAALARWSRRYPDR